MTENNAKAGVRADKGFTLVELLIVVALMAVIAAIAVPSITKTLPHQRLNRAARDILSELNAARLKAITSNNKYKVVFTLNAYPALDTYRMYAYVTGAWTLETTRTTVTMPAGIDITAPTSTFEIIYNSNGTATATNICLSNLSDSAGTDKASITFEGAYGKAQIGVGC